MLRVDLSSEVTARLHGMFAGLPPWGDDTEQLLARLLQSSCALPVEVVRQLLEFRASPHSPTAMLITGMPIDHDLPPTPYECTNGTGKRGSVSECAILAIAILLGEPMAYQAEENGALVQDIYPVPSQQNAPSNRSSLGPLGFHTELTFSRAAAGRPFHLASPDFVLLLGLRCPEDRLASTAVIDARRACQQLTARQLATLRTPQFQLMAPYSFTGNGDRSRPWSRPVALLRGPAEQPSLAFDTACGVRALTPEAEEAIKALTDVCNDPELNESVQLGAGDLLIFDNNRCAHSRQSFPARFDGRDRWLQRVYVRRAIWPLPVESPASFRVLT